eukprot:TRINITY_DN26714_c0_g1_i1.p1 TRINITY_DN26714_c0_g1~~TRINITY_DN26714_c0_g1_i1.p1  ORF type:complete len:384 (-),score=26.66 TRINITY_DN26714_c0_g1_i1:498-1571(-)
MPTGYEGCKAYAIEQATVRKHPQVATEHFLWAIFNGDYDPPSRARTWLEQHGLTKRAVNAFLDKLPFFKALNSAAAAQTIELGFSPRVDAIVEIAKKLTGGAPLTSESFLAGVLIEGTSVFADAVDYLSKGKATGRALLKDMHVDESVFFTARKFTTPWDVITIGEPKTPAPQPLKLVTSDFEQMQGPTDWTNWLIPGRVLIGRMPYSAADVRTIVGNGVNTFACLLEDLPTRAYNAQGGDFTVLHFPVEDFDVADAKDTVSFVAEVARRLKEDGATVYIHCRGGHGRTGMISIELLQAVFPDLSAKKAKDLLSHYHAQRKYCGSWGCHMPETDEQVQQTAGLHYHMSREAKKAATG